MRVRGWLCWSGSLLFCGLAPGALGGSGQDKVLWFRKKATARSPHSKTFVLEIPAQRPAPTTAEYSSEVKEGKFYLSFPQASKATPYEYTVVKPGIPFNAAKVADASSRLVVLVWFTAFLRI